MMLCLSKRIVETDRLMRREAGLNRNLYLGHDLPGKTVGIVGIGHVGTRTAALCGGLFRMRVLACDPYLTEREVAARGGEKTTLDDVLRQADYVSMSCPLTAETRGMIGAREYALMKKGATFITTARGGIHDEAALYDALAAGHLAGAGLDVWEHEPPPPGHPLLQLDNVLASPHLAGVTHESRRNTALIAAQQLIDILDGKRPPRLLNPDAWPAYATRFERAFGFTPAGGD
jgi:D-3-phosphoglycerate dehydrogenase